MATVYPSKVICILGRQPALGIAECQSLFGVQKTKAINSGEVILDMAPEEFPGKRMGGITKAAKFLAELPFNDWPAITEYLIEHVPKHTCCIGEGKLLFGISAYGFDVSPAKISATSLSVKKAVRNADQRPVRVVPNKDNELNSAQVLHNKLAVSPLGMELLIIKHQGKTILAQTFFVQNIEAYAARDQKRPKRDARVGMLPPKLAQIIINLAAGHLSTTGQLATVLDPFCGTGVMIQEALLMGCQGYGTDIEPRMVEYSSDNLAWLSSKFGVNKDNYQLKVADATEHTWNPMPAFLASETYLGRPFSALPRPSVLSKVINDVDTIHRKFLKNLAGQTQSGFRLCLAIPAWARFNKPDTASRQTSAAASHRISAANFIHLPFLEHLAELGYTRHSFERIDNRDLIYYRPGQVVGRELLVLHRD